MVEFERLGIDVANPVDGSGVADSELITTDEPVTVGFGELNSGVPVQAAVQYFAAMNIERELDEDEQAQFGGRDALDFSSVLLAGEDGEAEQEAVVNVTDGGIDEALAAFTTVIEDGAVDITESSRRDFAVEDGELVENTPEPETE